MIRVMIVEDQKLVRSLLESYIQNEDGYQLALSIPGAAEAPILCDTEDIDLVLMDVQTEQIQAGNVRLLYPLLFQYGGGARKARRLPLSPPWAVRRCS